jgi:ubiquinone/menaquinone biosynthesis C-methylase UbiE
MTWNLFERHAASYEQWYSSPRGRRADQAERALLGWLLSSFPDARSVLEIGCGTGHFAGWLAKRGSRVIGLERSPAMLAEMRARHPLAAPVLGDAHQLPFQHGAVDLTLFVTTLEFLGDPQAALAEACRVSRGGVIVLALNRWSPGGLSRRWGPQSRQPLLSRAQDISLGALRTLLGQAARHRLRDVRWSSGLFPGPLWPLRAPLPLGDVIGAAARLSPSMRSS